MTNPDNALGTNGAFGGRTSVNAFNDVLATFDDAGIVSGFEVEPDTGMTVNVGGSGTVRDVAVTEDPFGNRTTVDNISGDPIPVTIDTASTTTARIDSIVAYVNSPANASDTSVDNPTACGIISVNGTSGGAPLDAAIRTAITADGGTGSTAYYVVIANVSVPANTTTITSGLISAGKSINLTNVATTGSNGLMSGADKSKLDGIDKTKLDNMLNYSTSETVVGTWINGKPIYRRVIETTSPSSANIGTLVVDITGWNFGYLVRDYFAILSTGYNITSSSNNDNAIAYMRLYQQPDNRGYMVTIKNSAYLSKPMTIILEYTKSTD